MHIIIHIHRHQGAPSVRVTFLVQVAAIKHRNQKVYDVVIESKEKKRMQNKSTCRVVELLHVLAFPSCFVRGVR